MTSLEIKILIRLTIAFLLAGISTLFGLLGDNARHSSTEKVFYTLAFVFMGIFILYTITMLYLMLLL